ncbi:MAG: hypothetical protein Fur0024_2660 [Patescibacteria group bacterium]
MIEKLEMLDKGSVEQATGGGFAIKGNLIDLTKDYISTALVVAGVLAVIYIIISGFQYITSSGDDKKMQQAKSGIKGAISGLIMIFLAYGIVQLVKTFLGA